LGKKENMEAVEAYGRDLLSGNPRVIEVPEWQVDGSPMRLHVFPELIWESDEINEIGKGRGYPHMVATIIVRSKDQEGMRVFDRAHYARFFKGPVTTAICRRVYFEIISDDATMEQAEKNSETRSSDGGTE
jgi:hypothetical protein